MYESSPKCQHCKYTFSRKELGIVRVYDQARVCKLCHLWLSSSTLSARAVLGVKAPISQSFTLLSTEQKLGLGDRDLARAPALS